MNLDIATATIVCILSLAIVWNLPQRKRVFLKYRSEAKVRPVNINRQIHDSKNW
jgi:hypothetical protein